MPGDREPVGAAEAIEPGVELTLAELDDLMTLGTHEVVVVLLAAEAVTHLAGPVNERIDHAVAAQEAEGPVHRREPDRDVARPQRLEDLLGGGVVRLGGERLEDLHPLARGSDPARRQ